MRDREGRVVVSDLMMPGMDGSSLLGRPCGKDWRTSHIPTC